MRDKLASAVVAVTLVLYAVYIFVGEARLQEQILAIILSIIAGTSVYFIWKLRKELVRGVEG